MNEQTSIEKVVDKASTDMPAEHKPYVWDGLPRNRKEARALASRLRRKNRPGRRRS